ncbi:MULTISPECIES: alpha/beta hydrolase [Peribacillus]|uniref:alpha/beta hydrolase n=1 Tax=Peribacillus TaxID=2675229 RepID=UPI001F4D6309|nr:alpha/beta hydrolase [Peribacillus sp. Aquil_B1]MCK2010932.1 alpha/beta hydrolase [Peribacillus sp. Aquil_B8]
MDNSVMDKTTASTEVTIKGSQHFLMHSSTGKREYQIFVSKPLEEPPASGYPVIYLLDANSVFGTMVEAVRLQSRRPEKSGVVPAIIVGIGYATNAPFSSERYYDFTMPVADSELPERPDGSPWPSHGGAEDFLKFIEDDLKPEIGKRYKVDYNSQTLFGHSLGGLFALYVLFENPYAFQTYIAGSPSLHWNKKWFREEEDRFICRLNQGNGDISLLLGVGELEGTHKSRMNENVLELSKRLSLEESGVNVQFKEFEEEGHLSVLPPLINRALRFALKRNVPGKK